MTAADGTLVFADLIPGNYTVTELVPGGTWFPTTPTNASFFLPGGSEEVLAFGNACVGYGAFGTKGYWHNKNGLMETTPEDLVFLNGKLPWTDASDYFGNGDEPFDGKFKDGTLVAAVTGDWGEEIAPVGSPLAEQSHFLVDPNASGDPREQLAQQLDAFIMNTRHRIEGSSMIQLPDGSWSSTGALIDSAIITWAMGLASEQNAMASLLDTLNNSSAVGYISPVPCPVVYP
jgi:hypothetical protein